MASLKDIKTRINSVKSTQKITNAMKLVSAAKFARASHAIQAARRYSEAFDHMVASMIASGHEELKSPLLAKRSEQKVLVIVVATDRGLCGGLNSNLFRMVRPFVAERQKKGMTVDLYAYGRRAIGFAKKLPAETKEKREKVLDKPSYNLAREISRDVVEKFVSGQYDRVYLAYARFQSALNQEPRLEQLLPVGMDLAEKSQEGKTEDYIVEPSLAQMLDSLLERKVTGTIYRVFLDGAASEHGARMTAMDSATNNAREVIRKLTLEYNRARQAAITTELTEIISGAESLN